MQEIRVVTRITNITDLEQFKSLITQAVAITEQEPGTLQYECYINEAQQSCTHLETFTDADAVAIHVQNVAHILQAIIKICQLEFTVLGESNPKIDALAAQFDAQLVPFFGGLRLMSK